ncbi:MAG TPA: serine protease [Flavobacteriales bacterium]|nr:serine protease [Flavobacteriales bacterium]
MRAVLFVLFLSMSLRLFSISPFQYLVSFRDKQGSPYSLERPEEFLSERSVLRREKQKIPFSEEDLPINQTYLSQILKFDSVRLRAKSKWFNDVVIEVYDTSVIQKMRDLNFVKKVEMLPSSIHKSDADNYDKWNLELTGLSEQTADHYGRAYHQIHMLGGDYLHDVGYTGRGMLIAVIDAGFTGVPKHEMLKKTLAENRIVANRDFVDKKNNIYSHSGHGTYVLTLMAANEPGVMVGTAPDASFLLLRSEDGAYEYLLEEYFWVEAAEFADSAGADVVNTSLGYTEFDDTLQNHTISDLDGLTTRISRGSNIACKKGMLLFNSAGNSGTSAWQKISAPADGLNLIAVGAVDSLRVIADFSSRGPTADGRIKPDLCAEGKMVVIGNVDGTVSASNGTSFSSPILAGVGACLWQNNAHRSWEEVKAALMSSADRVHNPDTNYGYGIPNVIIADAILKGKAIRSSDESPWLSLGPNPFDDRLICTYNSEASSMAEVKFRDINGRLVRSSLHRLEKGNVSYLLLDGNDIPGNSGMYILELTINGKSTTIKVIRR